MDTKINTLGQKREVNMNDSYENINQIYEDFCLIKASSI